MTPSGYPMLYEAARGLDVSAADIVVAILRGHDDQLGAVDGIRQMFGEEVTVLVFDEPTKSQSETVYRMVKEGNVEEPFLIKDSDNVFSIADLSQEYSYVCVESLNNFDEINPRNKSYVQVDSNDMIMAIKEKVVISDRFCVGGYFFHDPQVFCATYERLCKQFIEGAKELYVSDIIGSLLLEGVPFAARSVSGYTDWGTVHEWNAYNKRYKTFFVNLDGVAFERGSPFFRPNFRDVQPNAEIISELLELEEEGNEIIFVSERTEEWREFSEQALAALGFGDPRVVMGCHNAQHVLVNAALPSSTLPTARVVNLFEQGGSLKQRLRD